MLIFCGLLVVSDESRVVSGGSLAVSDRKRVVSELNRAASVGKWIVSGVNRVVFCVNCVASSGVNRVVFCVNRAMSWGLNRVVSGVNRVVSDGGDVDDNDDKDSVSLTLYTAGGDVRISFNLRCRILCLRILTTLSTFGGDFSVKNSEDIRFWDRLTVFSFSC